MVKMIDFSIPIIREIKEKYITNISEPFYIHKINYKIVNIGDIIAPKYNTKMLCKVISNIDGIVNVKFIVDQPTFLDTEQLKEEWIKIK
jgi:hypothetical protein